MSEVSRRRFLTRTSLGVGVAVAAVAALPHAALAQAAPPAGQNLLPNGPLESLSGMALLEPMVIHVRDVATAEIAVLVGTQEFVYRDPALVAHLVVQTARRAADTEG
jgi:hypothetical protein